MRAVWQGLSTQAAAAGLLLGSLSVPSLGPAEPPPPDFERIVDAIYRIEGGTKAVKPFGILSVSCASYADCRHVCRNTVRNTYRRWVRAGRPGDYVDFLGARYAPLGAANDPRGLNRHWVKNVRSLLSSGINMSAGQHKQQNRHAKSSRGGRLLSKLGHRSRRTPLWRLRQQLIRVKKTQEIS